MANPNIWAPGVSISANSSVATQAFTATAGQTLFTIANFQYSTGTGSLYVFIGGLIQRVGVDYIETSATSFTLVEGAPENAIVYCVAFTEITSSTSIGVEERRYWCTAAGADTITLTSVESFAGLAEGISFLFLAVADNTGPVTLNVNTLGDLPLYKNGAINLDAGEIVTGALVVATYDGVNYQLGSGAGGSGAKASGCIHENSTTILADYTLTTGKNGLSVGPITVADGVTFVVPPGARYVVL